MATPRATQLDIARKAGVGRTTVSLALKDNPKISVATRRRVQSLAKQLGYIPDPMLSALAMYRTQQRPKSFQGTLAWLINGCDGYDWKSGPYYVAYFGGAAQRAASYGYQIEEFLLQPGKLSGSRLASMLHARNTTGILLCPQPHADMEMPFAWDGFSAVTFGYSLTKPLLHTVASAHFLNTRHVMNELARRGYRRPGLVIDRALDLRCGSNVHAGFLIARELNSTLAPIPPLLDYHHQATDRDACAQDLADYIRRHRLDALVTADYTIIDPLKLAGYSLPDEIGVAGLSLTSSNTEISGIVEDSEKIGAIAVDVLVGMIQRGERGVPPLPIRTHLEGTWHDGITLRSFAQ
jgi:LacI family transcriptional regulator/LacI family repressor for deo operon, udp, cdd, tsx, nupC, and nupG